MVLKELSTTILAILLVGGMGYWAYIFFQKYRFLIKYGIFRRKYNEDDVKKLIQYLDAKMSSDDVAKIMLLNTTNKRTLSQVREMLYIYSQLQKIERRTDK